MSLRVSATPDLQSLNGQPINQAALLKLLQTGSPPNEGMLYLLQLLTWAEEQDELKATNEALRYRLSNAIANLNNSSPQATMALMYPPDDQEEQEQQDEHAQRLATMMPLAAGKFLLQRLAEQADLI